MRRHFEESLNSPTAAQEDRSCLHQITMFLSGKNPCETLNVKVSTITSEKLLS